MANKERGEVRRALQRDRVSRRPTCMAHPGFLLLPVVNGELDLAYGSHFCHCTFGQCPGSAACEEPVGPWMKKTTAHWEPNSFLFSAHLGEVVCFAHCSACWERNVFPCSLHSLPTLAPMLWHLRQWSQKRSDQLNSFSRSRASGTAGSRNLKTLPFCPGWLPVSRATSNLLSECSESGLCTL